MIGLEEFMDGHRKIYKKEDENYGFEDFLRDFEGEVRADIVAMAWNKLARKYKWDDRLEVKDVTKE